MRLSRNIFFYVLLAITTSFTFFKKLKPTLYIIGDSTVKNSDGSGRNGQWGWGSLLHTHFDTNKIVIRNHAIGGRSSRTFITEERWSRILKELKKGDYVLIQFGHNDGGALDDTARARGTIKGTGNDSVEIYNPIRKMKEVVHTYGWYMRKYVNDATAVGAVPVICSPVPRNNKRDEKVPRDNYATWSKQVADETGARFIPLNEMIAVEYEKMDSAKLNSLFFGDHTHTSKTGAELNAQKIVQGIKALKGIKLKKYLL